MTSPTPSRRTFSAVFATLAASLGAVAPAESQTPKKVTSQELGISRSSDAIHQEIVFKASPSRVYHALTDPQQFDKVIAASGVMKAMGLKASPAKISPKAGGAFSLFGDYITGRHVELTPNVRIIQAWRAASWAEHIFSIARFELSSTSEGTRLVFDHTGFPNAEAESLASGWKAHYWEPLAKILR
jgi:uncharacterized protein YndB with AHSA1/START domain